MLRRETRLCPLLYNRNDLCELLCEAGADPNYRAFGLRRWFFGVERRGFRDASVSAAPATILHSAACRGGGEDPVVAGPPRPDRPPRLQVLAGQPPAPGESCRDTRERVRTTPTPSPRAN